MSARDNLAAEHKNCANRKLAQSKTLVCLGQHFCHECLVVLVIAVYRGRASVERAFGRLNDDWAHICSVLALTRGEHWEHELPADVKVGLAPALHQTLVIFRYDVGLDYLTLPTDGAVIEIDWNQADDTGRARIYARNGELLRTQDEPIATDDGAQE